MSQARADRRESSVFVIGALAILVSFGPLCGTASAGGSNGWTVVRPEATIGVLPPGGDSDVPLDWWNVVVLVNSNSPSGLEVVKMYREFHPQIADEQIVYLTGLTDSASATATPADEIITRADFETYIAEPTRAHLIAYGMVDLTYVIITTAGMPYRIEDTDPALGSVVQPAGSNAALAVANRYRLNAASVESELSVLFEIDPSLDASAQMPIDGRVVNPYQGYRSSIKKWADDRDVLTERNTFRWTYIWRVGNSPKIEGLFDPGGFSALDRRMCPGSIYLVARLDGPRVAGESPVFAVREMLERSAAVSDPQYGGFVGYDAGSSVVALDHSPSPPAPDTFAYTQIYNFPPQYAMLDHSNHPIPPGGEDFGWAFSEGNHFSRAYQYLTGLTAPGGVTIITPSVGNLGGAVLWDDTASIINDSFLGSYAGIIGLQTYGRNGGDGRPPDYLLSSGADGGALFTCAPGAVFSSLESFNAVTMFTSAATTQGKIVEFIEMGGTAAVGHSFEPEVGASVQGEFLLCNLLRDDDNDGVGDLSVVEAVFTSLPYLSWAEVLIGDPLTRLHTGPGGVIDLTPHPGDVDDDGYVGYDDMLLVLAAYGSAIGDTAYHVPADLTRDGLVDGDDLMEVMDNYGTSY